MPDATRRPRRTRRRILWTALLLIVAFIAWQTYDIITGKPNPKIDYATQFYELCSNAQPEGENAWPLLERVLDRVEEAEVQLSQDAMAVQLNRDGGTWPGSFDDLLYRRLSAPNMQPHVRLLRVLQEEGTFKRLSHLATMARCVRPRVDRVPFNELYSDSTMRHNARVRRLARLQAGRVVVAARSWDWVAVADIVDQSLGVFQLVGRQPSLYEFMVASGGAEVVLRELRTSLVERPLDERSASRLLQVLDARLDWPAPAYTMAGERLLRLDNIQNEFTAGGRMPFSTLGRYSVTAVAPGSPGVKRSWSVTLNEVVAIVIPGRRAAERLDTEYVDSIVRIANSTDPSERQAIEIQWASRVPAHQFVVQTTTLPATLFASCWMQLDQAIQSTRLMLAIEIYIAREGRAPNSLGDLAPDILSNVPRDPLNDQSWGYRRLSQTSSGSSYLLWSFGEDGEDNNCEEDDGSSGLHTKAGTDIWINRPRDIPAGVMR